MRIPGFSRRRLLYFFRGLLLMAGAVGVGTGLNAARIFVVFEGEPLATRTVRGAGPAALAVQAVLAADQRRLADVVNGMGGEVLQTYSMLNHAAFVSVPDDQVELLRAVPGVRALFPERHHQRHLQTSTASIGARTAWAGVPGRTGRGMRIGIIDSGIDYLHADFGGTAGADGFRTNDPTRIEPGTFPTPKVIGGVDLVGDQYDAGSGSSVLSPDPDPLDPAANGHGSHVAGIAAGMGVLRDGTPYRGPYDETIEGMEWRVAPGVAPEASLYALKVFGNGGLTSSSILVQALERAADPNQDGDPRDRLDVVNMSLGSPFGTDDREDPEVAAVRRLMALGCVVVISAGNSGNTTFIVGSPGTSPEAITVANTFDAGFTTGALRVESPAAVAGLIPAVEGNFTPALAGLEELAGRLVLAEPNLACEPLQNAAALNGNIALVDRGTCFFVDKIRALQQAGARAVVVVNNVEGPPITMSGTGDVSGFTIPAVMIGLSDGLRLKQHLAEGVEVTLSSAVVFAFPELADSLNESSSRGPVWPAGRLKPDLAAPGSAIDSARAGSGSDPASETGTSMSAPHVAGAAALVMEARPGWSAEEIKAVLMNTARTPLRATNGAAYPESRVGSGQVAVDIALQSPVLARSELRPAEVSISFGTVLTDIPLVRTQSVQLINHGPSDIRYQVRGSNTLSQPGVRLVPTVSEILVPAGQAAVVPVRLEIDPAGLVADADGTSSKQNGEWPRLGIPEASGQVWFHGGPVDLHVPWHVMVRALIRGKAGAALAGAPVGEPVTMPTPTSGTGGHPAPLVGVFQLGYQQAALGFSDSRAWTDVVTTGVAGDHSRMGSLATTTLYFAVVTAGPWPAPLRRFVVVDVEIDRDGNGVPEVILSNSNAAAVGADDVESDSSSNDSLVTAVDRRTSAPLEVGGILNSLPPELRDTAPYLNSVMVLSATGAQLGLSAGNPAFRYRVVTRGPYSETTPWITVDPTRLLVDGSAHGISGTPWQDHGIGVRATIRRGNAVVVGQTATGQIPVLLVHLHNAPGNQAEVIRVDLGRPDVDNDALPDAWELGNLGDLAGTPLTDRDADGDTDGEEWWAGTDPLDPQSRLRLRFSGTGERPLEWSSLPGRRYALVRSRTIDGPYQTWRSGINATTATTVVSDPELGSGSDTWFYRLQIEGP